MNRIDMRVDTAHRLRDLASDLREAGRTDMRKNLAKRLREAGKPAVQDVRRAVRATPSRGVPGGGDKQRGGKGLRALIAAATQANASVSVGNPNVRIRVSGRRFPAGQRTLPKYLDGELGAFSRWRHPVRGHPEFPWIQQDSHPYFFTTMRSNRDEFRDAVVTAIDDTLDELSAG